MENYDLVCALAFLLGFSVGFFAWLISFDFPLFRR